MVKRITSTKNTVWDLAEVYLCIVFYGSKRGEGTISSFKGKQERRRGKRKARWERV